MTSIGKRGLQKRSRTSTFFPLNGSDSTTNNCLNWTCADPVCHYINIQKIPKKLNYFCIVIKCEIVQLRDNVMHINKKN